MPDAYEALNGMPLASLLRVREPWHLVRGWLADLAREIDAGLQDGPLSALKVEHVWITRDGYAKLLDFRAPDVQPTACQDEPATLESGQAFLAFVARSALYGSDDEPGVTVARAREAATAVRIGHARDTGAAWVWDFVRGGGPHVSTAAGP